MNVVIKIGKTNNLDQYLTISDIGLLPIIEGSGTNLKLLNYIKFGLQVVSTEFGIRGYKDLSKYINILPLQKFSDGINGQYKSKVPNYLLKKSEWKNLALKLNDIYKDER